MASHQTNGLLKYALPALLLLVVFVSVKHFFAAPPSATHGQASDKAVSNSASRDSAAESLETLTANLALLQKNKET